MIAQSPQKVRGYSGNTAWPALAPARKSETIRQVVRNTGDWKTDMSSTIIPKHVNVRATSEGNP